MTATLTEPAEPAVMAATVASAPAARRRRAEKYAIKGDVNGHVLHQMRLACRQWNSCAEAWFAYCTAKEEAWESRPEVAAINARLVEAEEAQTAAGVAVKHARVVTTDAKGEKHTAKAPPGLVAAARDARAHVIALKEEKAALRDREYPAAKRQIDAAKEAFDAALAAIRGEYVDLGLDWGTAGEVIARFVTATGRVNSKRGEGEAADIKFHPWKGDGCLTLPLMRHPERTQAEADLITSLALTRLTLGGRKLITSLARAHLGDTPTRGTPYADTDIAAHLAAAGHPPVPREALGFMVEKARAKAPLKDKKTGAVLAPTSGHVHTVMATVGAQVAAGDVIATLAAGDGTTHRVAVTRAATILSVHVSATTEAVEGTRIREGDVIAALGDPDTALRQLTAPEINAVLTARGYEPRAAAPLGKMVNNARAGGVIKAADGDPRRSPAELADPAGNWAGRLRIPELPDGFMELPRATRGRAGVGEFTFRIGSAKGGRCGRCHWTGKAAEAPTERTCPRCETEEQCVACGGTARSGDWCGKALHIHPASGCPERGTLVKRGAWCAACGPAWTTSMAEMVTVPIVMHRPLPPDADIVEVEIIRRMVGPDPVCHITLSMTVPAPPQQTSGGIVAAHNGWRSLKEPGTPGPGDLRVCTLRGVKGLPAGLDTDSGRFAGVIVSHGDWAEIRIPEAWRVERDRLEAVQGKLDEGVNELRTAVAAWLRSHPDPWPDAPAPHVVETWKSQDRFPWLGNRFTCPDHRLYRKREEMSLAQWRARMATWARDMTACPACAARQPGNTRELALLVGAWYRGHRPQWVRLAQGRKRLYGRREDAWRMIAQWITQDAQAVALDAWEIPPLARIPEEHDEAQLAAARANRQFAAPGELRAAIIQAAQANGVTVLLPLAPSEGGTAKQREERATAAKSRAATHLPCGYEFPQDQRRASQTVYCPRCDSQVDQDVNTADVMLDTAGQIAA